MAYPTARSPRSASRRSSAGRPTPVTGRLAGFHLEAGLPVWRFEVGGVTLEKRLLLPHLQNTVYLTYRLVKGDDSGGAAPDPERPVPLILRPLVHFRSHDAPVNSPHPGPYRFTASADRYEISCGREIPPCG